MSHHTSDPLVVSMVDERHKLLNQLNDNPDNDQSDLKRRLNKLRNNIKKRLKELKTEYGDRLANQINSMDDSRKMFESMRLLNNNNNNNKSDLVAVFNDQEQLVANDAEKAVIVREWFNKHYTGDEPALAPFEGEPRPLNSPITPEEPVA